MPTAVGDPSSASPGLPRWPGVLAAAIAIVANLWTLQLGFSQDDFPLVSRVSQHFLPEPWFGEDPCSGDTAWFHEVGYPVPPRFMFRVTAWALWWVLVHGAGGVAHAIVFHIALILIHGATTFFLFRFLQRATDTSCALLASVVFAIEPGSIQALTWAAAAGDLLSATFMILSAIFLQKRRQDGRLRFDILAGLFFALVVGSKESALFFGPAVALALLTVKPGGNAVNRPPGTADFSRHPSDGISTILPAEAGGPNELPTEVDGIEPGARRAPLWRLALCFAIPLSIFVLARHSYTNDWLPRIPQSRVIQTHASAWEFLAQALAPWEPASRTEGPISVEVLRAHWPHDTRTTIRILGAVLAFLPCLLGMLMRPRWLTPRLAAIVAAGAIGMYPIATVLLVQNRAVDTNAISRAAHPFFPMIATAIAFGLFAARESPRWAKIAVVAPLLLWQLDFLVHVARFERAQSESIAKRLSSLAAIIATSPPDARLLAIDPDLSLGIGIEHAFRPPFFPTTVPITWIPRNEPYLLSRLRCVLDHPGPVVIAQKLETAVRGAADEDTFQAVAILPPIPNPLPGLERVEEAAGVTRFRFREPVPLRALAGFRVRVKPGPARTLDWAPRYSELTQWPYSLPLDLPPDQFTPIVIALGTDRSLNGRLEGFEFSGGAEIDGIPVPLASLPGIALSVPSTSEGKIPPLAWTTVPDAASHEILIKARMGGPADTLTASITPDEASLRAASSLERRLTFEPSLRVSAGGVTIPWPDALAGIVAAGRARDPKSTVIEFQVTARDRYGAIAGRSEWQPLYLGIPD